MARADFGQKDLRIHASALICGFTYRPAYALRPEPTPGSALPTSSLLRYANTGNGILTVFPSATPIGLALGPD